jgi:hypothetical protein
MHARCLRRKPARAATRLLLVMNSLCGEHVMAFCYLLTPSSLSCSGAYHMARCVGRMALCEFALALLRVHVRRCRANHSSPLCERSAHQRICTAVQSCPGSSGDLQRRRPRVHRDIRQDDTLVATFISTQKRNGAERLALQVLSQIQLLYKYTQAQAIVRLLRLS